MVEGEPVAHPGTPIVPDDVEALVAQAPHQKNKFGGDLALVPRPVVAEQAATVARQIRHHDGVVPGEERRHGVPGRMRLWIPMEQEDGRTLAAHHAGEPHARGVDGDGSEPVEQARNRKAGPAFGPRHFRNSISASVVSVGRSSGSQWPQPAMLPPETSDANSSSMPTIAAP